MKFNKIFAMDVKHKRRGMPYKNTAPRSAVSDKEVCIATEILDDLRTNVGMLPPETGGILACSENPQFIDTWRYDEIGSKNQATSTSYSYDVNTLSFQVHEWRKKGIQPVGFLHSHPHYYRHPSYSDLATACYLMKFFRNPEFFYLPILMSNHDGCYTLYMFVARSIGDDRLLFNLDYVIQANPDGSYSRVPCAGWSQTHRIKDLTEFFDKESAALESVVTKRTEAKADYFVRLAGVFPEKVLNKVIFCIGVGGARMYLEQLSRNGFRNFVLIDGDKIAPPNIATQGVYISEMGQYKTEACRASILDINPTAKVICMNRFLDDSLSDEDFETLLAGFNYRTHREPTDFLMLGCCDSFAGNSRSAALAMKYGLPFITCGLYPKGAGGEICFTYPGVTPSCPRCMLRKRYETYEEGNLEPATSTGSHSFHTERFNSILGEITLMLLMYHEAPGNPYNEMLDQVKNRNFVWIRMSPCLKQETGIDLFDRALGGTAGRYTFYDETLWIPQTPDGPEHGTVPCKMCGGSGDLRVLVGRWRDTRKIGAI